MNLRNRLCTGALLLFGCCALMFSACQSRPEFPDIAAALEAAGALRIELIDPSYQGEPVASGESLIYSDLPAEFLRQYVEISPERLQKLSPSLTSCDGLTEVGRLNHAGQTTYAW